MNRRDAIFTALAVGAMPLIARSQPAAKPARVVFLRLGRTPTASPPFLAAYFDAFKQGMRELGHVEGKTYQLEPRWTLAKGEDLAKEIATFKPDVIIASEVTARAAQPAAPSVPIVLNYSGDPVAGGFAKSLARPGANVTGLATLNQDTSPKLLELLLTVVPGLTRVAVLANPNVPSYTSVLKNLRDAARQARVDVLSIEVRNAEEIDSGFARIGREQLRAAVVPGDSLIFDRRQQIADLALKHAVASVYPAKEHVEAGGLASYGVSIIDGFRRAAAFVDKILKGAKPGDLPIEQATTLELVINQKTAKALGLTIPQSILLRADRVIE